MRTDEPLTNRARSYLNNPPITPILREKAGTFTGSIGRQRDETSFECFSPRQLKARPARGKHVCEESRNDVGNGLVEKSNQRHAKNPELKCHEDNVFSLSIFQTK